ncbi:DUF6301 family protein [Nocardia sp. NBC_01503]|uniref:DUF6301 family protein n=1 Tax=Nocardia sp. NBC_01503 TaxID=2975997 RepID=UPI002E7AF2F3|nr:DUF6301 family protein [Nocardia sp. NBC_01503]WTL33219.1 DUF6301 family protein [Nocardia sp. NBC_01503]
MYVESDKIEHIIAVAASFDWTWTEGDLPLLSEALGWRGVLHRTNATTTLRTDLVAAQSQVYWRAWDKGGVRHMIMVVTDKIDSNDVPAMERLLDDFRSLVVRFSAVLGSPHCSQQGPGSSVRWDRANLVVRLFVADGYINLHLVNPAYQEWLDTPEEFEVYE